MTGAECVPGARRFAHPAMATVYEVIIQHDDALYAEQAAAAAFGELDRLERELSRFLESSDIAKINVLPPGKELKLGLDGFECLRECLELREITGGAFDISIGPLLKIWTNPDKTPRNATDGEIAEALNRLAGGKIHMNEARRTVTLDATVSLDLGGYGKGYALDRMAAILDEWEVPRALVHGGGSTVYAMDAPDGETGWPVAVGNPFRRNEPPPIVRLRRSALSGSGVRKGWHILDPRTGRPAAEAKAAWSSAPTAAVSDALSTAFMVLRRGEIPGLLAGRPELGARMAYENGETWSLNFPAGS